MLAVSNIAWPQDAEAEVAAVLADLGVSQIEIAPTKVFDDPLRVGDAEMDRYVEFWRGHGIEIVAFQSMLFGRDDLVLFEDPQSRQATARHLTGFLELAGRMGAGVLVFGSPRNRRVPPQLSDAQATAVAVDFFGALAECASAHQTTLCIEPNPAAYGTNFVTTAAEGAKLVEQVNHPGFGLHLDAAGITLAGEDIGTAIADHPHLRHFHVSAPFLGELEESEVDHSAAAAALIGVGYDRAVSIEMRPVEGPLAAARVGRAVALARRHYRGVAD